jgi:flagellar protein FlgJ
MDFIAKNQLSNASIYSDLHSLEGIRKQAQVDSKSAIKAAAKEFEAFFMNMMLKSMRQASEVIGDDNMFGSPQEKMFIGMLDEQMSVELSQKGNLGVADLMIQNLLGETAAPLPQKRGLDGSLVFPVSKRATTITADKSIDTIRDNKKTLRWDKYQDQDVFGSKKLLSHEAQPRPASIEMTKTSVDTDLVSTGKPEKKSLFESVDSFVGKLLPMAQKAANLIGVDPRLLIAQAALETGWGKYIMHDENGQASHNLFGIKGSNKWGGDSVSIDTLEIEEGQVVKKKQPFRMYESFENSFSDYVNFLKSNPRYQSALSAVDDSKKFVSELQSAGYATDPKYAKKILEIFNKLPLTSAMQGAK